MAETDGVHHRLDRMHDRNDSVGVVAVAATGIDVEIDRLFRIPFGEPQKSTDHRDRNVVIQSPENVDIAGALLFILIFFFIWLFLRSLGFLFAHLRL